MRISIIYTMPASVGYGYTGKANHPEWWVADDVFNYLRGELYLNFVQPKGLQLIFSLDSEDLPRLRRTIEYVGGHYRRIQHQQGDDVIDIGEDKV